MLACSRAAGLHDEAVRDQAGLDCVRLRVEPAGDQKEDLSTAGPGQNKKRGTGFRTRSKRRKQAKLRKSRSGTKALLAVSAGQTQELETTVETLSVLTCTNTCLQYKKMKLDKSTDASVGVDFASSHELEALRPRPARWTHRADLHPLGCREDEV
ncbi:hypothetical protein PF003_g1587 [Phytophthora fragariae]|nr:hypothetical protein PF003_g1587 [Phytophthora fragariae]